MDNQITNQLVGREQDGERGVVQRNDQGAGRGRGRRSRRRRRRSYVNDLIYIERGIMSLIVSAFYLFEINSPQ